MEMLDYLFQAIELTGDSDTPAITVEPLAVSANGEYEAEEGKAYSPVNVNVRANVIAKSIVANGTYSASESGRDGFSQVYVDVRGDFLPAVSEGYTEYKNVVQSSYIKGMISTATGSTTTVRTGTSVSVAVGDKILLDGSDATNRMTYAAWGTVTATRAYSSYRSITLRVDGASVRPTGSTTVSKLGYGTYNVVGDLAVQVSPNLENIQSYPITQNGQYVLTAQSGYDGIGSVTVDVNVSGGGGDDPTLITLDAYSDGTYNAGTGMAYSAIHVATGQYASPGERIVVALDTEANGTFTPSEYVAFGPVSANVVPAESGTKVVDITVYGDGDYVAAQGFAFGTVTVATNMAGAPTLCTVNDYAVDANGYYTPELGYAYGTVTVAVAGGGGGSDTLGQLLAGTLREYTNDDLTSIPESAFYMKPGLVSASFGKVTEIGMMAFQGCTDLESVSAPNCAVVRSSAFMSLPKFAHFDADACIELEGSAFAWSTALANVYIPNVQIVGAYAFAGCSALSVLDLPFCEQIGTKAFADTGLEEIHIGTNYEGVATLGDADAFDNLPANYVVYVPSAYCSAYQSDATWSSIASHIQPE